VEVQEQKLETVEVFSLTHISHSHLSRFYENTRSIILNELSVRTESLLQQRDIYITKKCSNVLIILQPLLLK